MVPDPDSDSEARADSDVGIDADREADADADPDAAAGADADREAGADAPPVAPVEATLPTVEDDRLPAAEAAADAADDAGRFRGDFELAVDGEGLRVNAAVDGARDGGVRMLKGFGRLALGVVAVLGMVASAAVAAWAWVNGR